MSRKNIKAWIEAMRLRTLPVSIAGVIAGCACALFDGKFRIIPPICCLLFALGAQIASNFANEYFDYSNGLDRKGREGFRRGVTEGDISPGAMKRATFLTLFLAAIPGSALICYGGWWLIIVGIIIGLFALAYSTGPYPLSHHGLGDIAVIVFFGLVPVGFTACLITGNTDSLRLALPVGGGIGLLAANVLIVNNYRDFEDDMAVGKKTTVVIFGPKVMGHLYLMSATSGLLLLSAPAIGRTPLLALPLLLIWPATAIWRKMMKSEGTALNNILKFTALLLLGASLLLLAEAICI